MKTCADCKLDLDLSNFCKKKRSPDGYSYYCRGCASKRAKKYYQSNDNVKQKILERNKVNLQEARMFVMNYLLSHPCVDCPESRPACLDFDHLYDKRKGVSQMVSQGYSIEAIQKEIDKCEVRCSNCHRVKTAEQLGWYLWYPRLDSNQH